MLLIAGFYALAAVEVATLIVVLLVGHAALRRLRDLPGTVASEVRRTLKASKEMP